MDPEVMEEFKEQHAKMTNLQNAVTSGDTKTGPSAITEGEELKPKSAANTPTSSSTKSRGNRNKRR
ncbi:hypothetical protein C0992_003019 [Termitomyces sp. T32_za158]|nr:hypothetical protein C0992_003019 [Termitomyces sp. T32_za158]